MFYNTPINKIGLVAYLLCTLSIYILFLDLNFNFKRSQFSFFFLNDQHETVCVYRLYNKFKTLSYINYLLYVEIGQILDIT